MKREDIKYFKLAINNIKSESEHDIVARCPICGDSKYHKNKARLHLYEKNGVTLVNCFNGDCPCRNKTVYNFLKDFYPHLLNDYKKEVFKNKLNDVKYEYCLDSKVDWFENKDLITNNEPSPIKTIDLTKYFGNIKYCYEYLKSRNIDYTENFGKWYYGVMDLKIDDKIYNVKDSIIIPLYYRGSMYGFYSRKINNKQFYTFIHQSAIGYKIWNWFNINKDEPVYIFEGIFDALSAYQCGVKNIIACIGAKIPDERLKELKHPIFCLDNDRTGLLNMLDYSKKYTVCIMNNKYKDCNEMLIHGINVKQEIENNLYTGIMAQVKIRSIL